MNQYKIAWEKWLPDNIPPPLNDNWGGNNKSPYEQIEEQEDTANTLQELISMSEMPTNPILRPKDFNFWTGYSNFYLTKKISNIICSIEGIESLDIVSPYRMRIAIGKLFQAREVMNSITKKVIGYINNDN